MIEYEKLLSVGGLSLERLATLCRVDEAGGLSKAAGGDISKLSLYSRQLKDLERFFGAPLTRRVGRTIVLTDTARAWAAQIRGHFKDLLHFREAVGAAVPVYTLGASHSLLEWWLWPRLTGASKSLPPGARIETVVQRTAELVRAVESNELDAALVRADAIPRTLSSKPLFTFGYSLLLLAEKFPVKHKLSKADFARLPLAIATGGQFKKMLHAACERAGVVPNILLECPSNTLAAQAMMTGNYAAVLPDLAATAHSNPAVRRLSLPFPGLPDRQISLVWNPRLPDTRLATITKLLGLRNR